MSKPNNELTQLKKKIASLEEKVKTQGAEIEILKTSVATLSVATKQLENNNNNIDDDNNNNKDNNTTIQTGETGETGETSETNTTDDEAGNVTVTLLEQMVAHAQATEAQRKAETAERKAKNSKKKQDEVLRSLREFFKQHGLDERDLYGMPMEKFELFAHYFDSAVREKQLDADDTKAVLTTILYYTTLTLPNDRTQYEPSKSEWSNLPPVLAIVCKHLVPSTDMTWTKAAPPGPRSSVTLYLNQLLTVGFLLGSTDVNELRNLIHSALQNQKVPSAMALQQLSTINDIKVWAATYRAVSTLKQRNEQQNIKKYTISSIILSSSSSSSSSNNGSLCTLRGVVHHGPNSVPATIAFDTMANGVNAISETLARKANLPIECGTVTVNGATSTMSSDSIGTTTFKLKVANTITIEVSAIVLPDLRYDIIIGVEYLLQ